MPMLGVASLTGARKTNFINRFLLQRTYSLRFLNLTRPPFLV